MNATERLARHIVETTYKDLPRNVVEMAKSCVLDSLGCALGGHQTEIGNYVVSLIRRLGGVPESTIIGSREKTSCASAAFANSTMANALDFDDTYIGHPGATVIPPAINVGEAVNASSQDLIVAIVLGYEISIRIGAAMRPSVERKCIHGHGTWQTFGAVTVASKLLNLNSEETMNALGIAGSNAPVPSVMKTVYNVQGPNMVKNNYGISSMMGILAALLAQKGFTGPRDILDGETGFWRMYGSDRCNYPRMIDGLGKKYEIMNVNFKLYPSCRLTHSAIDAAINILRRFKISVADIKKIVIRTYSPACKWPFTNTTPQTMLDAQFSTPYSLAVAIRGITPGLDWFAERTLRDPDILRTTERTVLIEDAEANEAFGKDERALMAKVEIYTEGRRYGEKVNVPRGDPQNPFTKREAEAKFRNLASKVLNNEKVSVIIKTIGELEKTNKIGELTNLLF